MNEHEGTQGEGSPSLPEQLSEAATRLGLEKDSKYREALKMAGEFATEVDKKFSPEDAAVIKDALALAVELHHDQADRLNGSPYILHVISVARTTFDFAEKTGRLSKDLVIAALLHDSVEDQAGKLGDAQSSDEAKPAALKTISERYGQRAAEIVANLTNPDFKAEAERAGLPPESPEFREATNRMYVEHIRAILQDPDVFLVKLADFSDNALKASELPEETAEQRAQKRKLAAKDLPVLDIFEHELSQRDILPLVRHRIVTERERLSREANEASEEFTFTPEMDLKIDLFAQGLRLTDEARAFIRGYGLLTTGDYVTTEGIMLRAGDIYINAPFSDVNPFAETSPHTLEVDEAGRLWVVSESGRKIEVEYIPPPAYIDDLNDQGTRYGDMIATHADRARLSPIQGCALDCQFCNIPSKFKYQTIPVDELVDAVGVALGDPKHPARHLLISGGTPGPRHFDYLQEVYENVARAYPGLEIDIMMTPSKDRHGRELLDPEHLKAIGINALSVNLELNDDELAPEILGRKANIGKAAYLEFLEKAVDVFGVGKVRSIIIVGLEPIEQTLQAVEELAKRGICPELSPFRPDPGTPLKDIAPPSAEDQKRVYIETHKILDKYKPQYPDLNDGLQCVHCMHNVLVFPR